MPPTGCCLRQLEDQFDPCPADPWPCHHQHYGASLALTVRAYRRVGGLPAVPYLEDEALWQLLLGQGLPVRHSPHVQVYTSARRCGRVEVGLSWPAARVGSPGPAAARAAGALPPRAGAGVAGPPPPARLATRPARKPWAPSWPAWPAPWKYRLVSCLPKRARPAPLASSGSGSRLPAGLCCPCPSAARCATCARICARESVVLSCRSLPG